MREIEVKGKKNLVGAAEGMTAVLQREEIGSLSDTGIRRTWIGLTLPFQVLLYPSRNQHSAASNTIRSLGHTCAGGRLLLQIPKPTYMYTHIHIYISL